MYRIHFHEIDIKSGLSDRKRFKLFLESLFTKENKKINQVDIIFCNDGYLRNLNKKFLGHDYNTDTLTFLLSGKSEPITGELYISIDTILSNSKRFNQSKQMELKRVIIHGCLHLCGYSDKPMKASEEMQSKQESYLLQWCST